MIGRARALQATERPAKVPKDKNGKHRALVSCSVPRLTMGRTSVIVLFLLLVLCPTPHEAELSACCNDEKEVKAGCRVTDIASVGKNALIVRREDGSFFYVQMSIHNLIPRVVHPIYIPLYQWYDSPDNREWTRVTGQIMNGAHLIVMEYKVGKRMPITVVMRMHQETHRLRVLKSGHTCKHEDPVSLPSRWSSCDPNQPEQRIRKVITFYSSDRMNSTVVYYEDFEDKSDTNGCRKCLRWTSLSESGEILGRGVIPDDNDIISATGFGTRDGKELIASVDKSQRLCFWERPFNDSFFRFPTTRKHFADNCIPANVLFGCPQSFCKSAIVDEVTHSYYGISHYVTFYRGMHYWTLVDAKKYPLRVEDKKDMTWSRNKTLAAAFTIDWMYKQEYFFPEEGGDVIVYTFGYPDEYPISKSFPKFTDVKKEITATYLDEYDAVLHVLSRGREDANYSLSYGITSHVVKAQFKGLDFTSRKLPIIDAMFKLDKVGYQKSGQYIWEPGKPWTMRLIVKHAKFNPNGILDTSYCGWTDEEAEQIFRSMNDSMRGVRDHSLLLVVSEPIPVTEPSISGNGTTTQSPERQSVGKTVSRAKVLLVLCVWWFLFFFSWSVSFVLHHRRRMTSTFRDSI